MFCSVLRTYLNTFQTSPKMKKGSSLPDLLTFWGIYTKSHVAGFEIFYDNWGLFCLLNKLFLYVTKLFTELFKLFWLNYQLKKWPKSLGCWVAWKYNAYLIFFHLTKIIIWTHEKVTYETKLKEFHKILVTVKTAEN